MKRGVTILIIRIRYLLCRLTVELSKYIEEGQYFFMAVTSVLSFEYHPRVLFLTIPISSFPCVWCLINAR
jgi:hypothetical protein